ncbi:hypothetical protein L3Y34_008004 [Caenorhabditis briggsae]|uniref:Serpentine receptor class r-10 n=1 Tax=Caenorhabditis briggsae TaxID=6238 RepID=A0AAE9CZL0_CAEBR|nr:hypothetical protein L3Y34_008004 [Caenorhabditis briggsae]
MLIVLCIFTVFYSFVEIMLQPLIHLYDDTLFLIQRKRFDLSKTITRLIPTTYCWCYAMSFCLFALQFLYRYVAVCKPQYVGYFAGCYFYYWLALILSLATSWGLTAAFMFPQTNRTTESFLYVIETSYDLDPYWADYVAYKYFDTDENHVRHINVLSFFGVLQHGLVISLSFGTLFYCGVQTYVNIKKHTGMSEKTRSLQLQLFRALVAQTCLPMFMMYIPIGFMFSCPYFDLQLGAVTNYQTVMAQLYPGIDPFVVLFLIDAYRRTILNSICPRFLHKKVLHKTISQPDVSMFSVSVKPSISSNGLTSTSRIPHLVVFFTGCYFYYWLALILSLATSWGLAAAFMFPQTNRTTESFLYVINSSYDLDPYWTSYVAYKYFDTDENHTRHVNILSFFGVLQHGLVISLSFGTLFYCGIKTYLNIKEHVGMSTKTRSFQLQLFRALVVQTCLSMMMMYMPIGFMFSCPYFDLQLGAIINYQTVMAQLYPGIDPFVVLLIIDSYRKTILSKICPAIIYRRNSEQTSSHYDISMGLSSLKIKPSSSSTFASTQF